MNVYDSIMQGLNEAVEHQQGKGKARSVKMTAKPVYRFSAQEIKDIRNRTGLSQVVFAGLLGVSPKTVEAWESGRNKPEGPSCRLLEIVRDDPEYMSRYKAE